MPTAQETKKIVFLFLSWRAILFLVGKVASAFILYKPSFPYYDELLPHYSLPQWLYSWANFDGVHYLTIAEKGYVGTGSIQAFFPLFPYVILHSLKVLLGSHFNGLFLGLLISNLATLAFLLVWFAFVKRFKSVEIAWMSLFVLLLFPTSFFLGALYTESLFLLLIIGAFYFAEKEQWFLAGLLAIFATSTRIVGIFIVPALLIELFRTDFQLTKSLKIWSKSHDVQKTAGSLLIEFIRFTKQNWWKLLWLSCGILGTVFYMVYLDVVFKDPLYFAHVQASFGSGRNTSVLTMYPQVLYRSIHILLTARPFDFRYWSYVQEFLAGSVALLVLFLATKKVRFSHMFFAIGAFLIPTLTGSFSSMPRYILVCFPIYIFLAQLLHKHHKLAIVWFVISAVLLIVNTVLFIQGYWIA